ncbi:MAG: apolipoprotein N-acyltransferase [Acidiferrobacterales bacterium]
MPLKATPARLDILALVAGGLLPLAFSPVSLYPLAIVSLALLFCLWQETAPARAAWRGFLFGFGQFAVGVSWLYVALHTYGQMSVALTVLTLALFFSFLACYPALVGWLQARLYSGAGSWTQVLGISALWTLGEWLRGWLLTGFPWLAVGYSQIDGPLAGLAPWLGVYGVSLAAAVSAGLLAQIWRLRRRRTAVWGGAGALAAVWLVAGMAGRADWVRPAGAPLRVALVQGDVPLAQKWMPAYRGHILRRYTALTFGQHGIDLAIWPEAAVPFFRDQIEHGFLAQLRQAAEDRHMEILLGILERQRAGGVTRYYNSVIGVGKDGGVYRKHHLVPFGEYIPFATKLGWLFDDLRIPMSDLSPGPAQQPPLQIDGQAVGMSICYEDVFGPEVMRALPQATLLANVTEDAWYGHSLASFQQMEMARMRALEAGREMMLATNTGVTAIIDSHGRVVARAPQFRPWVLTGTVTPLEGATPYVRYGNRTIVWLLTAIIAGLLSARLLRASAGRRA